jgi:tetratricopeptide (TPR) repeat protein
MNDMMTNKWFQLFTVLAFSATCAFGQGASAGGALQDSYDAEKNQDYPGAIKPLEKLGAEGSANYIVQLRLGWLHYCAKNWSESIAYYGRASQLSPQSVEPLLGLMLPQMAAGKNDDALRTAQTIIREDPGNYTAISRMAWLLYSRKDYSAAVSAYRKLVTFYPTDTEMLLGLGWALRLSGHASEAAKQFQTVLLLSPGNTRALEGLKTEQQAAAAAGGGPGRGPGPGRGMMQEPPHEPGHRPTH